MIADLFELLRERTLCHPSRIAAVEVRHRELRVRITGRPWWSESGLVEEGAIEFIFAGVREGILDADGLLDLEDDEALEALKIAPLDELSWSDAHPACAIYCLSPLPEPLALYAVIADLLWTGGSLKLAGDYLNMPDGTLSSFLRLAKEQLFLVANAPAPMADEIVNELTRQGVPHSVVALHRSPTTGVFVQLGGSRFVCESATARW